MLALGQTFIRASIYAGPGHSRNDSRNVFVNRVLSRTYGNPANPVSCPMREDVKKKILPLPPGGDVDVVICIQPLLPS
jgi:hypothetical protein